MLHKNITYYGKKDDLPGSKDIRAGHLEMIYEKGFLRYINFGNEEVIRMIYFAVRDPDWVTIEGTIKNEKLALTHDGFNISYQSIHKKGDIDIVFNCNITGIDPGKIRFELEGISRTDFWKNRIGFCILHPIVECMGKPCAIGHWNGSGTAGSFPQMIAPHQPFMNIRTMQWKVTESVDAIVRMEGEVFESEDQRNWTDASYKTYGTPLGIPFPVRLRAGERIHQIISLEIIPEKAVRLSTKSNRQELTLEIIDKGGGIRLPAIGTGESSFYPDPEGQSPELVKKLDLDHLRVEVDLANGYLETRIAAIKKQQQAFSLPLMLVIFTDDEPGEAFERQIRKLGELPEVRYVILFDRNKRTTPGKVIHTLGDKVRQHFPGVLLGAGTNMYFTELNRERVSPDKLDFLVYSINPQVHAFDNRSLTETLEAQSYTVHSAKAFSAGRDIVVSPVTLKPRFNPDATGAGPPVGTVKLPCRVDERQMSLFGAGWTLGSLKYLAEAGVKVITYYETCGWRGLLQGMKPSPSMDAFHAVAGDVFPLYLVFKWMKKYKDFPVVKVRSSDPLVFDGLCFYRDKRYNLFLSNFTAETIKIRVKDYPGKYIHQSLDADNVAVFRKNPETISREPGRIVHKIVLKPFSINRIILSA